MRKIKRPVAFILANTAHGTMILNRNDHHRYEDREYGVGIEILNDGAFCADEIGLALKLLDRRRDVYGEGVHAIDCGANIGVHSIEWGHHMTGWGTVLGIEAQEYLFYALAGNIVVNNCFNVKALHLAASNVSGEMKIPQLDNLKSASFGSLELSPLAQTEDVGQEINYCSGAMIPVRSLRLDELEISRLDLLKIDVEGMELAVLEGARSHIQTFTPMIIMEFTKSEFRQLEHFLKSLEYLIFNIDGMNLLAVHSKDKSAVGIMQSPRSPN